MKDIGRKSITVIAVTGCLLLSACKSPITVGPYSPINYKFPNERVTYKQKDEAFTPGDSKVTVGMPGPGRSFRISFNGR